MSPKVLICTPKLNLKGGVAEFNRILIKYSKVDYAVFGFNSVMFENALPKLILLIFDYIRFIFTLVFKKVDLVHINPSLTKNSIIRDGYYVKISKWFKKPVFVQWHGWNPADEIFISGKYIPFLKKTIFKADHITFLSGDFEKKFINAGFKNKTSVGNTMVDDDLLKCGNVDKTRYKYDILFLSTIAKTKGIFTAIDAFVNAQKHTPNIRMAIAGVGPDLTEAVRLVKQNNISGVDFVGHVTDCDKSKVFNDSRLYIFPSMFEGMPTSVLEAMAMGLPVICNRVGAIVDFFIDGEMGFSLSNGSAKDFSEMITKLLNDNALCNDMGTFNTNYAKGRFLASKTTEKIKDIYLELTMKY